jgi:hypothetical protein
VFRECGKAHCREGRQEGLWLVRDIGAGWKVRENHCVWEDEQGTLWDVTPNIEKVAGEHLVSSWAEETEFEQDDTATFADKSNPGQYIPPTDNQHLKQAAEFMQRGDKAMNAGDWEGCRYWTQKANVAALKGGSAGIFDIPASCTPADIFRTIVPD